ncbi:MAG: isochorismatase family protein [Bacilli bacterium]|nr:isochorismatase family protein [Bacilli bacterium]
MKKLLVVVDFQVDFVNGALGFAGAEALDERICFLIKSFEDDGNDVVFTLDTHHEDYMNTEEGKYLPVPHCIEGTPGYDFYGNVKNMAKGHKIFAKPTFPSLELGDWLKDKDYEEVTVCGLDLSICVLSNAVIAKAALPNAHIVVDASCSSGGDEHANAVAIEQLKRIQVEIKHNK